MAHLVDTMAWTNEVPWHGLGAEMKENASIDHWLKASGLDWGIHKAPLKAHIKGEKPITIPNKYAFMRDTDNKLLTVASGGWVPFQNRELVEFMKNYVIAGGASIETLGSLKDGKIVWCLAKLNHQFEVTRGDKVNGYLLLVSNNTVGTTNKAQTTTVRVVCNNTMSYSQGHNDTSSHYVQNHMTEFNENDAKDRIGLAHEELALIEKHSKIIAKLNLSRNDAIMKVFAPTFFPKIIDSEELSKADIKKVLLKQEHQPKQLQKILLAADHAPGAIKKDTGWKWMNAATYYTDHIDGWKSSERLRRAWICQNAKRKQEVEKRLLKLAS